MTSLFFSIRRKMIELKNVCKKYGSREVIKDVSLAIKQGEIYGLVGLSGAGKSTLLRMINGLETLTSGEIYFNQKVKFGFIFQNFNLVNALTVGENIKLALVNEQLSEAEKQQKVKTVLKLVGLLEYELAYPKNLSGGQCQRIGIARALVSDVNVLLCDEATSALDPFTAKEIIGLLKDLNQQLGLTIVFVSHQLELVKDFCDYIAIIDSGKVYESGLVLDVLSNPQTKVAIKLLGGILGFDKYLDNKQVKVITCYDRQTRNDCLKQILSSNIELLGALEHHTKQGNFAHVFINNCESINGYELRSVDGY